MTPLQSPSPGRALAPAPQAFPHGGGHGSLPLAALLLALALPASAGTVAGPSGARPGPLFTAPAAAWSKPLHGPLVVLGASANSASLAPLLKLDLSDSLQFRALGPIVRHLETSLEYTPEKFAALRPDEQRSAIQLAAEEAVEEVRQKAYALIGDAGNLVWAKTLDKDGRAELFRVVAQLQELRAHYGPYLDGEGVELAEKTYAQAAARAYEIRQELIDEVSGPAAKTLAGSPAGSPARGPPARTAAPVRIAAEPSATAQKLILDMENNKSGWGEMDIGTLLTGYGFVRSEGGKHIKYQHPLFPQLYTTVSHQRDLPPGYARDAVRLAREVERLRAEQLAQAAAAKSPSPSSPRSSDRLKLPARVDLAELEILLSPPAQAEETAEETAETAETAPPRSPSRRERRVQADAAKPEEKPEGSAGPDPASLARLNPAPPERAPETKPETPAPETSEIDPAAPQDGPLRRFIDRLKRLKPR